MIRRCLKRVKTRFAGLKLNVKFMLLIILFVEVTIGIFSGIFFYYMEKNVIQEKINEAEYEMNRQHEQVRKNVDSINMSTQFFLNDQDLLQFLTDIKQGKTISREELNKFYHENVATMERMINSNSYLYQIRVYVEDDKLQEMMPVLYKQERMRRLEWAQGDILPGWKFDYTDTIFDSYALEQNRLLALITLIEDFENGELAVLEVAMSMETMFEGLYGEAGNVIEGFLDENGVLHYESKEDTDSVYMQAVLEHVREPQEDAFYYEVIDGKEMVIGQLGVNELSGTLIRICDISSETGRIRHMRNVFVFIMVLCIPFLAMMINVIVKAVLRQFYKILQAIQKVQTGNLDVVIENCGTDEMGELGKQFNKMLSEIKQLMEDDLNRELLVKNSEIKALQNQINAHFIYNVLESIKMMAEIEEKYEISDAITSLGKLLRYSMRWNSPNVKLEDEIEYIKNYLKLINLRFDYEIYLSLNISEDIYSQQIPKMSLQPIVENAIYHGIEQMAEDTNIYIKGIVEDNCCMIEVSDAGNGMSEEELENLYKKISGETETESSSGNGIGLKNVQDRIKMNFGEEYGMEIASQKDCYTKVTIRIPFRKE